jgi:hypothetical protein
VAFAACKVWDLCRETKKLFIKLCEEIRAVQVERGEVVELQDGEPVKLEVLHYCKDDGNACRPP